MTTDLVRVGDILRIVRRDVIVDPAKEYLEIGVRSFGKGIFHKEPTTGSALGAKRVFRIEPGDLVISNVFAWEGAVALAGQSESGRIGSHRFMTFVAKDDRADLAWASWFFVSEPGLELIRRASPGSAGRNRTLAIERFENLEILLPPISEQRRIAEGLNTTSRCTRMAEALQSRAGSLSNALYASLASRPDISDQSKLASRWRRVKLGELLNESREAVTVSPESSYPNVGVYSFGRGLFRKPDIDGARTSARVLNRIHAGQFLYSRLFAFEGAFAHVADEFEAHFVSNEFPIFDAHPELLDPRWLAAYLRAPTNWGELSGSAKGLGVRRQRVHVDSLLGFEIQLPPLGVQAEIVKSLSEIERLWSRTEAAAQCLRALLPSALNRSFPTA